MDTALWEIKYQWYVPFSPVFPELSLLMFTLGFYNLTSGNGGLMITMITAIAFCCLSLFLSQWASLSPANPSSLCTRPAHFGYHVSSEVLLGCFSNGSTKTVFCKVLSPSTGDTLPDITTSNEQDFYNFNIARWCVANLDRKPHSS